MKPIEGGQLLLESTAEVIVAWQAVEHQAARAGILPAGSDLLPRLQARVFDAELLAPYLPDDSEIPFTVRPADTYLLKLCLRIEVQRSSDLPYKIFTRLMLDKSDAWEIRA